MNRYPAGMLAHGLRVLVDAQGAQAVTIRLPSAEDARVLALLIELGASQVNGNAARLAFTLTGASDA